MDPPMEILKITALFIWINGTMHRRFPFISIQEKIALSANALFLSFFFFLDTKLNMFNDQSIINYAGVCSVKSLLLSRKKGRHWLCLNVTTLIAGAMYSGKFRFLICLPGYFNVNGFTHYSFKAMNLCLV